MSETDYKIDPTAFGLFLVAIVSLPLAIMQLKDEGVPTREFFTLMGILILVVSYIAYRNGSNFGFIVFGLVGAAVTLTGLGMGEWECITFGIVFLMALIWSALIKTPETLTFSKRRVLYGLNLAKKTKRPNMILCEGNLDVVTLHQAGFDNAVASMGTALTVEQTRLLSRYTKELVLCYDNDKAGALATQRALELLNQSEFSVRVLRLPNRLVDGECVKQDADDFIKLQGPEAFERLLSGSANGVEFRLNEIAGKYDLRDDQARVAYAEEVSAVLCTLENAVEREVYTTRAAETAGLTPEALRMEVQRAFKRKAAKDKKARERRELNPVVSLQPQERGLRYENLRSALAEEGVIRLLLLDDGLFGPAPPIPAEEFSSPLLGRVYASLWESHMAGRSMTVASLSGELTGDEMSHLTAVVQKPESRTGAERALEDYCRVIHEEAQKRAAGAGTDPLAAAAEKYKNKKGYGGKHNDR